MTNKEAIEYWERMLVNVIGSEYVDEPIELAITALKAVERLEAYCDASLNDDPVYDNEELVDVLHYIKSILKGEVEEEE